MLVGLRQRNEEFINRVGIATSQRLAWKILVIEETIADHSTDLLDIKCPQDRRRFVLPPAIRHEEARNFHTGMED